MQVYRFLTGPIQVNTYLAWDDTKQGFIVDPGGYSKELTARAKEGNIDIKYILLTHGHGDHIGGVEDFKKDFPDARIVAYEGEKELMTNGRLNASIDICGRPVTVDVDMYVKDGDELTIGNTGFKFLHTPGHTKGGMCIATDGYVFSGDTLFRASIGRTDFYGGSFEEIMESIKGKLFALPGDTLVLPGHMGETTIEYEKENNPFV